MALAILSRRVASELTNLFGGVTAYMCTPTEGRWKPGRQPAQQEDIAVFEAMVETIDSTWWRSYRKRLEKAFK